MSAPGALTLTHVRADKISIQCRQCQRKGVYTVAKLMARYGTEITLPSLKDEIVADAGCPQARSMTDPCKATYTRESVLSWTPEHEQEVVRRMMREDRG